MPVVFGRAPGKIILFGEHAVVYGQPAIAIPVTRVKATAHVFPNFEADPGTIQIQAPDIALDTALSDLPEDHPLGRAVKLTIETVSPKHIPAFTLHIASTIPISAGMGSGAAISVAVIRAVSAFLGSPLPDAQVSELAFEVEKIHHGTPSGIDNNVITYEKPVYFTREKPIEVLQIEHPSHWVIADTGEKTPTLETVYAVRQLHTTDPAAYYEVFEKIGEIVQKAKGALQQGETTALGRLMNENQRLLEMLSVSSPSLEKLTAAALAAGAAGAKLSGGGRGGNIIALVEEDKIETVKEALIDAGAATVINTLLTGSDK